MLHYWLVTFIVNNTVSHFHFENDIVCILSSEMKPIGLEFQSVENYKLLAGEGIILPKTTYDYHKILLVSFKQLFLLYDTKRVSYWWATNSTRRLFHFGQQPQIASKWLSDYFVEFIAHQLPALFPLCKKQICSKLLKLSTRILWYCLWKKYLLFWKLRVKFLLTINVIWLF